jgi:hypothetical protein
MCKMKNVITRLWLQILKEIWIIEVTKIVLKLIGQYGVQKYIFFRKFKIWRSLYIQARNWKQLYLLHVKTYLTHTWKNDTLKKIGLVKSYFHFQKPTFNILLQCIIWRMMHSSEKIFCFWLVNWKHQMH